MKRLAALLVLIPSLALAAGPQDAYLVMADQSPWWTALRLRTRGCPEPGIEWTASVTLTHKRDGVVLDTRQDDWSFVQDSSAYGCPPFIFPPDVPSCRYNCMVYVEGHAAKGPCIAVPGSIEGYEVTFCQCTTEFKPYPDPGFGPVMSWLTQPGDTITVEFSESTEWGMDANPANNSLVVLVP